MDALLFYEKISTILKEIQVFSQTIGKHTLMYLSRTANADNNHFGVGKDSGLTASLERFNGTLRQRCSKLVRKALSFPKSSENLIEAIKYFIYHYNLQLKTL